MTGGEIEGTETMTVMTVGGTDHAVAAHATDRPPQARPDIADLAPDLGHQDPADERESVAPTRGPGVEASHRSERGNHAGDGIAIATDTEVVREVPAPMKNKQNADPTEMNHTPTDLASCVYFVFVLFISFFCGWEGSVTGCIFDSCHVCILIF